jgi:hypothetical protein
MVTKVARKKPAKKKRTKMPQPQANRDKQIAKTQEQIDKLQGQVDAGDTSKQADLDAQKSKLARLQGGEDVPEEEPT